MMLNNITPYKWTSTRHFNMTAQNYYHIWYLLFKNSLFGNWNSKIRKKIPIGILGILGWNLPNELLKLHVHSETMIELIMMLDFAIFQNCQKNYE